jgi:hypothetical protein
MLRRVDEHLDCRWVELVHSDERNTQGGAPGDGGAPRTHRPGADLVAAEGQADPCCQAAAWQRSDPC